MITGDDKDYIDYDYYYTVTSMITMMLVIDLMFIVMKIMMQSFYSTFS